MRSFKKATRVLVGPGHSLTGRLGIIRRMRSDGGAWVEILGDPLPDRLRAFPADDSSGRGNHFILYPEECEDAS